MLASKELKSFGLDVQEMQKKLNALGFDCGFPDGYFGEKTDKAVMDFQKKYKLEVDGVIGNLTKGLVEKLYYENVLATGKLALTEEQIKQAAKDYKLDYSLVKAVSEVESMYQRGFMDNGQLLMLFESGVFWQALRWNGKNPNEYYNNANLDILTPGWVRNYGALENQINKLNRAILIDEKSAYESASYGLFQIMGFNFKQAGFSSAKEMVKEYEKGELVQLKSFLDFITNTGSIEYLRKRDFAGFAFRYNGAGYAQNSYDVKLQQANQKWQKLA